MSDTTDDLDHGLWAEDFCPDYTKWRTISGEVLNVSQMGTGHIRNCLKFV